MATGSVTRRLHLICSGAQPPRRRPLAARRDRRSALPRRLSRNRHGRVVPAARRARLLPRGLPSLRLSPLASRPEPGRPQRHQPFARRRLDQPRPGRRTWPEFQGVGEQLCETLPGLIAPSAARPASLIACVFIAANGRRTDVSHSRPPRTTESPLPTRDDHLASPLWPAGHCSADVPPGGSAQGTSGGDRCRTNRVRTP